MAEDPTITSTPPGSQDRPLLIGPARREPQSWFAGSSGSGRDACRKIPMIHHTRMLLISEHSTQAAAGNQRKKNCATSKRGDLFGGNFHHDFCGFACVCHLRVYHLMANETKFGKMITFQGRMTGIFFFFWQKQTHLWPQPQLRRSEVFFWLANVWFDLFQWNYCNSPTFEFT